MHAQTHHVGKKLPFGTKSEVQWALRPNGKALIFVHGFGGGAVTTWVQFPSLLQSERGCSGYDHFFYGYDGLRKRARPSADDLIRFLDRLFADPAGLFSETIATSTRPANFHYDDIVLIAHSLGAVVCRLALLDAFNKGRTWTSNTSLVLFAPAHSGANVLSLASLAMGVLRLAPVEALARYRFQVLQDLEERSQTLQDLRARTEKAIARGGTHLIAKRVVYAGDDKIVNPLDFCSDPAAEFIQGASHTSVCKPRADFRDPLVHLLSSL
jgi:pimeloyl-ACP methyl ester carboxylesterase